MMMQVTQSVASLDEDTSTTHTAKDAVSTRSSRQPFWKGIYRQSVLTVWCLNAGLFCIFIVLGILMGHFMFPFKTPQGTSERENVTVGPAASFKGICFFNNKIKGSLWIDFGEGLLNISHPLLLHVNNLTSPYDYEILILNHGFSVDCQGRGIEKESILIAGAGVMAVRGTTTATIATAQNSTSIPVTRGVSPLAETLVVSTKEASIIRITDCCIIGLRELQ